ncbi:hypothetical protein C9374_003271 [Naegleria lovaniensis]|uniref:WD repeat-containing protein 19 n=1 Tax=Naegleria lovaniensis TaxID=51637 RepID=A0AA88GNN2_NAELO|nr:uncharacterized protein C9374_003271 [Naegleria lovaniensis]KAG2385456.1 hypothetical protein C9374_003271 [Naegleria lovaniensis]
MKQLFTVSQESNGKGPVVFSWQKSGNYLACVGSYRRVQIFDRQGNLFHQISLEDPGRVLALDWDYSDETLAIMQEGSSKIPLFHINTKKEESIETNTKELSFMRWAAAGPYLAIGSVKGTLLIYNKKLSKYVPIKGKHTKKITCGSWNSQNVLALGSEDLQVTISDVGGDTLKQKQAKAEPKGMEFVRVKKRNAKDTTVAAIVGGNFWMYDYDDEAESKPTELGFSDEYGRMISFKSFGDGYLLLGFDRGYVVIASTHSDEIGMEVNSCKVHDSELKSVTCCEALKKGASIGENCVKVFDLSDLSAFDTNVIDKYELDNEYGALSRAEWTEDGQILTVSSNNGNLYNFLTSIPALNDCHGKNVLMLVSLRELIIKDEVTEKIIARFGIDIEPSFVALGPEHVAVGMNNRVWYYRIENGKATLISTREYLGTVEKVCVGFDYAAVLSGGKITMHLIEDPVQDEKWKGREEKHFPEKDDGSSITTLTMAPDFLIYATSRGALYYFSLDDWLTVNEFRHDVGIASVFTNIIGTRLVFIDETNAGFLYSPVDDSLCGIESFPSSVDKVLWDQADQNIFVACDSKKFTTYVYSHTTRWGPKVYVVKLDGDTPSKTPRPEGFSPIFLNNGKVCCQMKNGSIAHIRLSSHSEIEVKSKEDKKRAFTQNIALLRLEDAWSNALDLNLEDFWNKLKDVAIDNLELELALRVYRLKGNASMVMALSELINLDEINLIIGNLAMISGDFTDAESKFLQSTQPIKALEMRRDLMNWDRALQLAQTLDPKQIPLISREYANQLELKGEFQKAYELYQRAIMDSNPENNAHNQMCNEGLCRITIRLGDLRKGFELAMKSKNKKLCRECAQIFEELSQFDDAAALYEEADMYEKAAEVYIQNKSYSKVTNLMKSKNIMNPRLHLQFAKAKEVEGKYEEAANSYEKAGDINSVININLRYLNNIPKAIELVKKTNSTDGANLIATYCKEKGNYRSAIEFLIMAEKVDEAFDIAKTHDEMDTYAKIIENKAEKSDYLSIAKYYESKVALDKAADYYLKCDEYATALTLYVQCSSRLKQDSKEMESVIDKAIDVVAAAKNDNLTHSLIDFLMGQVDNVPKDPKHVFRLYMALGNFKQAASTALVIAKQEQEIGNYQIAHSILYDTVRQLEKKGHHVQFELRESLNLLHSYLIVKYLSKMQEQTIASRMLLRITKNISKFPHHIVPILTSSVLLCYKSGLKKSAFENATILVRPEHQNLIPAEKKKTIVQLVRKRKAYEDDPENASPCPICSAQVPDSSLYCEHCMNNLPMCISSGMHMTLDDWCQCPQCEFSSKHSFFIKMLETIGNKCPMCSQAVESKEVQKLSTEQAKLVVEKYLK